MKKILSIAIVFVFAICNIIAQDRTVTGVVTDASDGSTLPGVNILVKSTGKGIVSDANGKYTITVPSGSVIQFSYIGYTNKEVTVGNQTTLNVALVSSMTKMDEVVVTALGIKKQKRALSYAVQKVGDEIADAKETSVVSALAGRVAGVQISETTGVAGGSTRIVIRGNNSISKDRDNQPLIIVDGMPMENTVNNLDGSSGSDWGSAINDINPEDIADMSILKGPNAAALYGARAANGAIIITTKKGSKGKGIGVSYSFTTQMSEAYRHRDVQNVYGQGTDKYLLHNGDQDLALYGVSFWGSGASWGKKMDGSQVRWWDGKLRPYDPQPDNINNFWETAHTTIHNVAFSGGTDKANFRTSITKNDNTSIIPNNYYDKTTINFNGSMNLSKKLRVDLALSYIKSDRKNAAAVGNTGSNIGSNFLWSWTRSDKMELRRDNYKTADGTKNQDYANGREGGFFWNLYERNEYREKDRLIGSFSVNYDIFDWMHFVAKMGIDSDVEEREYKETPEDIDGLKGNYNHWLQRKNAYHPQVMLTFNRKLTDDIGLSGTFGGDQVYEKRYGLRTWMNGRFANPNLYAISNSKDKAGVDEWFYEKQVNGIFGSIDLSYKNWAYLQVTGRNDWTSTLPSGSNSYFYPSVSGNIILSELIDLSAIKMNEAKIRSSWAKSSTDDSPYNISQTFKIDNWGGYSTATVKSELPPLDLKPQNTVSYEYGADLSFFENRLMANFTYYYNKSTEQIMSGSIAASSGYTKKKFNSGSMENKGIELTLTGVPVMTNDLKWEVVFNFNKNSNKILELDDEGGVETLNLAGMWGANGPSIVAKKGEAYGTIYGWDWQYTEDGKQKVDADGYPLITDVKVPMGNITPSWFGGLINNVTYKNWTLTTIMDMQFGGEMWYGSRGASMLMGQSPVTLEGRSKDAGGKEWTDGNGITRNDGMMFENAVKVDGDGNVIGPNDKVLPVRHYWYMRASGWGASYTGDAIHSTDYVKMRQISVSYTLPSNLLSRTPLQKASISLVCRNPFFIYSAAPDNLDPTGGYNPGSASGIEFGALPGQRTYGATIKVSF